jgi:hypothetical protein
LSATAPESPFCQSHTPTPVPIANTVTTATTTIHVDRFFLGCCQGAGPPGAIG